LWWAQRFLETKSWRPLRAAFADTLHIREVYIFDVVPLVSSPKRTMSVAAAATTACEVIVYCMYCILVECRAVLLFNNILFFLHLPVAFPRIPL
jgi:hypothetical protein